MTCEQLSTLIENRRLDSYFQPIVALRSDRIIGYEALVRGPAGSPLHQPGALFDVAGRCGKLMELELLTREIHIENFARLNLPAKLFLNICPISLMERKYPRGYTRRFLEHHGLSPEQIVIELTEHSPIDDYDLFREALSHYRQMGFSIAIDDLGAGFPDCASGRSCAPNMSNWTGISSRESTAITANSSSFTPCLKSPSARDVRPSPKGSNPPRSIKPSEKSGYRWARDFSWGARAWCRRRRRSSARAGS